MDKKNLLKKKFIKETKKNSKETVKNAYYEKLMRENVKFGL